MSAPRGTVRAMERATKDTQFQLRIARDLLTLAAAQAVADGVSLSKWIRDLIAAELRRRGVLS